MKKWMEMEVHATEPDARSQ